MTREEAKEFYPILQAFAEGRVIECRTKPNSLKYSDALNEWTEMGEIEFWNNTEYRIKPKYRPFKNAKECWQEMLKHQPFGWLGDKIWNKYDIIVKVSNSGVLFNGSNLEDITAFDYVFEIASFADGIPFGIKEEV